MQISFKLSWKDVLVAFWVIGLLVMLSLVYGSFAEAEPKAGKMFGIITLGYAVLGYPLLRWRNKEPSKA